MALQDYKKRKFRKEAMSGVEGVLSFDI